MVRLVLMILLVFGQTHAAAANWGEEYFGNTMFTTETGEQVRFFDDLIKDRIVAINFIYTTCPDTCPLETARMVRVQNILGDRLGKDVFFYSITIDPKRDTPEVLKGYKERFGANWTFLTGAKSDIDRLRRKLGLYIDEIQDGSNNHNVSMIIGNQKTGRWMKKSPFENSHILADQIGNWLDGWKSPQTADSYANAPEIREVLDGEHIFRTRCVSCHTIDGTSSSPLGPDLLGVTERRDNKWLVRWLRNPEAMVQKKDPIAMELRQEYRDVQMPNMRLTPVDIANLLVFFRKETSYVRGREMIVNEPSASESTAADVVAIMNPWIRNAGPKATVNAGYITMVNIGKVPVSLTGVASDLYQKVEIHEMKAVDGLMEMVGLPELVIDPSATVALAPKGKHLMLMQPKRPIVVGEKVDLRLSFKSGKEQIVSFVVKPNPIASN